MNVQADLNLSWVYVFECTFSEVAAPDSLDKSIFFHSRKTGRLTGLVNY